MTNKKKTTTISINTSLIAVNSYNLYCVLAIQIDHAWTEICFNGVTLYAPAKLRVNYILGIHLTFCALFTVAACIVNGRKKNIRHIFASSSFYSRLMNNFAMHSCWTKLFAIFRSRSAPKNPLPCFRFRIHCQDLKNVFKRKMKLMNLIRLSTLNKTTNPHPRNVWFRCGGVSECVCICLINDINS